MIDLKTKMLTPANIILIGGLITLVLTYVATILTEKEAKTDQQKLKDELVAQSQDYAKKVEEYAQTQKVNNEAIQGLQQQLIVETKAQATKSAEIALLYKKLAESQETIAVLTKETQFQVTGEGYCFVNIRPESPSEAEVAIMSESQYPLYDVEASIRPYLFIDEFSVDKGFAKIYKQSTDFSQNHIFKVGTLPAKNSSIVTSRYFGSIPYDGKKTCYYTIDFGARNGEWRQVWEMNLNDNAKLTVSHIIFKTIIKDDILKRIVLHKSIHPKAKNSILEHLITESKIIYNSQEK